MVTKTACLWRMPPGSSLRKEELEAGYMWTSGNESAIVESSDGLLVNGHGNDGWGNFLGSHLTRGLQRG